MFKLFQDREAQTSAALRQVVDRNRPPTWFHSYSEYKRAMAAAYRDRAQFWSAVVRHCIDGPASAAEQVVFAALLDAREGCEDAAWQHGREARRAAREDQSEALHSYAPNIAAATKHTDPAARRMHAA
jgi:hypothetical protein